MPKSARNEGRAGALLTVDIGAVVRNWQLLNSKLSGARCAAVVKADAYGLGAGRIASALSWAGCKDFFVAHIDEGVSLRSSLATQRIFVLHGPFPGTEKVFLEHDLIPVLNAPWQLEVWRRLAAKEGRNLPVVLHLDTGMTRLGFTPAETDALLADAAAFTGLDIQLVMSHLACGDELNNRMNAEQHLLFSEMVSRFRATVAPQLPCSLAASSGIFLGARYHGDMVRPGIALYGGAPQEGVPNPMEPVIRLQGKILRLQEVEKGQTVGYGASYRAPVKGRVATVGVGYADGYLRSLSGKAHAYFKGQRVPLIGRVSMDLLTFDVSHLPENAVKPGDYLDLIGKDNPIDTIARQAGTISYEVLTALGHRYYRHYIGET